MTKHKVSDSLSDLQVTVSHPLQFGPRAFGPQRPTSQATVVRNIAESIITHRQLGQDRPISFYTRNPDTQALVQAKLDALALSAHEAQQPGLRYRRPSL